MNTFGDKLKAVRLAAGVTQERLAAMSGVSLGAVREYEQHKRDPLLSNAVRLARALKQPLEAFLPSDGEDAAPVKPRSKPPAMIKPAAKKGRRRKG